jgi:hypothetical protein
MTKETSTLITAVRNGNGEFIASDLGNGNYLSADNGVINNRTLNVVCGFAADDDARLVQLQKALDEGFKALGNVADTTSMVQVRVPRAVVDNLCQRSR